MGFGMIGGMLLFWIALVILVVMASRGLFESNRTRNSNRLPHSAKEILENRYARGEITREQFQQILKDLQTLS